MAKLEEFGHLQGQRDGKAMKSATEAKPSRRKWRPPGLYYLTVRVSRGLGTPIQTRVWHAEFFDDYFPMERLLAVGRIFYIVESRQRPRPALELIVESTADWQPPDPPVLQVVGISRVFPLRLVLRGKTGILPSASSSWSGRKSVRLWFVGRFRTRQRAPCWLSFRAR